MKTNFSHKYEFDNNLIKQTYKKLRFLHQRDFSLYTDFSCCYAIHVIVPSLNADYKFTKILETLQVIDTNDNSKVTIYDDYDFKLFIKLMKKILRGKPFNLRYED